MKKLKAALPKDEKEILEKGFQGNITDSKKFVTDEHSMFLAAIAPKGMLFTRTDDSTIKAVPERSIQKVWDKYEKRQSIPAEFIGCGKPFFDTERVVAVLRAGERVVILDPWIFKFALSVTGGDSLTIDASEKYWQEAVVLMRDGKMVGAVMPMRYGKKEFEDYDLTGPAVKLQ